MPATAASLRRSGKYKFRKSTGPAIIRPVNLKELMGCLDPISRFNGPFRPMGANSASTDCNAASSGTVIDMTGLDKVLNVDAYNDTVTIQAGVRIGVLADVLSKQGLELAGSHAGTKVPSHLGQRSADQVGTRPELCDFAMRLNVHHVLTYRLRLLTRPVFISPS